ncbi:MAG: GDSL-type esterase/lipase family protein [Lentisphaeraceae bacterium]|nr:GDSL-type esterase/lipase family protein [Lentisphaeraceae bacterium]
MKIGFCVKIMVIVLMTTSGFSQKKVACIGDSITYGAGILNRMHDSYPSQLQKLLGYDYEVKNFGVSGRTLLSKGDHPWIKEKVFAKAKNFKPDIIVIKLGTNDTKPQNWQHKSEFKADFTRLLASFPRTRTLVCLPVPAFPERWGIRQEIIAKELIPILMEIGKEKHLEIVDLHTPFLEHPEFFPDKIHPNALGAKKMAEIISDKLSGKVALSIDKTSVNKIHISSTQDCTIKYTLDGAMPLLSSPTFSNDLELNEDTFIRAAAYKSDKLVSRQFFAFFPRSKTTWRISSNSKDNKKYPVTNLIDNNPDTNWFSTQANSSVTIDFQVTKKLDAISWMTRYKNRKHHKLSSVSFATSMDGVNWQTLSTKLIEEPIAYKRRLYQLPSLVDAKFLRLNFAEPTECAEINIQTEAQALKSTSIIPVEQNRDAPGYFTHRRHSEILNRVATNNYDLVMIGDSITHHFGGDLTEKTFANRGTEALKQHLGECKTINMGFGWDRTENVLWRLKTGAISGQKPKFITLKIGTNNLRFNNEQEISQGIISCVAEIKKWCPNAKLILTSILPRKNADSPSMANFKKVNKLSKSFAAQEANVYYFDLAQYFVNTDQSMKGELYASDKLHLNSSGYEVWAKELKKFISEIQK